MSMKKYNFCTTQFRTATEKFVWTIENFAKHKEKCGEYLKSSEFISTAPDGQLLKWQMEIYPNGYKEESKDYIASYLKLIDSNKKEVEANYQILIRKSDGNEFEQDPFSKEYYKYEYPGTADRRWGREKFIQREDLLDGKNGYLNGGHLTIVCTLMVQQKLLLCERKLINSLDSANTCALLALANLYQAENLKTQAIGFIKMNLKEVMKSEGWTHADHQLKDQIFEAMQ